MEKTSLQENSKQKAETLYSSPFSINWLLLSANLHAVKSKKIYERTTIGC